MCPCLTTNASPKTLATRRKQHCADTIPCYRKGHAVRARDQTRILQPDLYEAIRACERLPCPNDASGEVLGAVRLHNREGHVNIWRAKIRDETLHNRAGPRKINGDRPIL